MAEDAMSTEKIIVIGGSAGSLDVMLHIISELPTEAGAIIIVVIHRRNDGESVLENLIANKTDLKVKEVEDKESIFPNTVYIAPPDYHLLVENENCFSLDSSEKVNYSRPSIDVTFESVADVFRDRVIAVLLSGANADGAKGLAFVKKMGGYTIVENPETAEVAFMPQQAINLSRVDKIVDTDKLPLKVKELLH